jgi:hypothetical protein
MFRKNIFFILENGISRIFPEIAFPSSFGCEKLTNIKNKSFEKKDNDFNNSASLSFGIISRDLDLEIRH